MCGITGVISHRLDQIIDDNHIQELGRVLRHRGPDNYAYYRDTYAFLASHRLSIIDVSEKGNQPFENDEYVLIYNGEIYNHLEIRKELKEQGVIFKSGSDSETLFHSLLRHGFIATLSKIKGMFAFAFWSKSEKKVFLARDRFGIKPLYYSLNDNTLYFSSEAKGIAVFKTLHIDKLRFLESLNGLSESERYGSLFDGVASLLPGEYLLYDVERRSSKKDKYFDLFDLVDPQHYNRLKRKSDKDIVEEFRYLFGRSIKSMMMSDVPLGVFASGGIDSSLISLYAAKHSDNLSLFKANVDGLDSGREFAELLASKINTPLYEYRFNEEEFVNNWAKTTYYYETPLITHTNAIAFRGLSHLATANHYKVVLTGEGSDELFLGYPGLYIDGYLKYFEWPQRILNKMYSLLPYRLSKSLITKSGIPITSQLRNAFIISEEEDRANDVYSFVGSEKERAYFFKTANQISYKLPALLHRNDRMAMSASLEARFPFLDEDIVKFSLNLSPNFKGRKTFALIDYRHPFITDKWVVRELSKELPNELVYREKAGFPIDHYHRARFDKKYFKEAYIREFFGFSMKEVDLVYKNISPYNISQLVAMSLFGEVFMRRKPLEQVNDELRPHISFTEQ